MAKLYLDPTATETINTIPVDGVDPIPKFTISPEGAIVATSTSYASYVWDEVIVNSQVVVPAMRTHVSGANLTFTGTFTDPLGGSVIEWFWDFGDGSTSTGQVVTHSYRYPDPNTIIHLRITMNDYRTGFVSMNPMLYSNVGGAGYSYLSLQYSYLTYASMQPNFATYLALDGIGYSYISLPYFYLTYNSMKAHFATYNALLAG